MTLSDLASVGSVISGLAVLASLIFVGFQLRQNTQAIRATASQAHSQNWHQITLPAVESESFARVLRLGLDGIENLTDDERVRFYAFAGTTLRFFEGARLQWLHGQLDEEHWHNVVNSAIDFAASSGFKTYWAERHHWLSPQFQKWYESLSRERAHELYGKPLAGQDRARDGQDSK
jgi:hypothetical protein